MYHSGNPPLVAGATTFPPQAGALWVLSNGAMSLQESIERFILPPEQGWQGNTIRKEAKRPENRVTRFPVEKSGAARIGGGERSEPVSRIVFMPYDTESKSRNVLASPLGEEGHEVAKGWTVVR